MGQWRSALKEARGPDTKQPTLRGGKNIPGLPRNNYRHTRAARALRDGKAPFPLEYVSGTRDACGDGEEDVLRRPPLL